MFNRARNRSAHGRSEVRAATRHRLGQAMAPAAPGITAEEEYRALVEQLPGAVYLWEVGEEGECLYVSPQIEALVGWPPSALVGDSTLWDKLVHPDDRERLLASEARSAATREPMTTEYRMLRPDGTVVWVRDQLVVVGGHGDGLLFQGVLYDVTEERQRQRFVSAVVDNVADGLCMVDQAGLITLVNPAAVALLGYESQDDLLGEEWHGKIHADENGEAHSPGECRLGAALQGEETVQDEDWLVRKDGRVVPVAYSSARVPLGQGSGSVLLFRDITERKAEEEEVRHRLGELSWLGRVRDALDENRMLVYAQPIVELGGRSVVQEELLVRMPGANGKPIPPAAFLPVAERYGLIREIDCWMVRQAVRRAKSSAAVAVNISAPSLGHRELVQALEEELELTGTDPRRLVFEITETALAENLTAATELARRLAELGCRLSLDDFGTGYGSFTYARRLPVSFLKIDAEFVRGLASDPASQHVVQAIVNLAKAFGSQTIAEGVEEDSAVPLLIQLGVDYAQGYLFGKPQLI